MADLAAQQDTTAALRGSSSSSGNLAGANDNGSDIAPGKILADDNIPLAAATGAAPSPAPPATETEAETEAASPPDPDKPNQRYIVGCMGDMEEAKRRWRLSLEWREAFGTDTILQQPHPYFELIKVCYPHYYCLAGYDGDPVYIERSGQVNQRRMREAGCGVEQLVWHYIYMTEFCYTKLYPSETAKTITVFDLKNVGITDLVGDALTFVKKSAGLIQEHYVERSRVILIVNTPAFFSMMWKIIKAFVNERTQKKVRIVKAGRETTEAIAEFVPRERIPIEYGGTLKYTEEPDSCRWHSPEETALRAYVHEVNKRHGVKSIY